MKTKCYCILCKSHPLHDRQNEFLRQGRIAGWHANHLRPLNFVEGMGAEVECLKPESDAFDELWTEPEEHEFKTCAYGDGSSETGTEGWGWEISAYCGNETYEEIK